MVANWYQMVPEILRYGATLWILSIEGSRVAQSRPTHCPHSKEVQDVHDFGVTP